MKKGFIFLLLLNFYAVALAQVNLQTGSSNFSLPMFNWQDDNSRLNAVVALSYSSGNGLKVNEVASNVGQGWRLISGGVISRMQAGEPDDQKPREGSPEDETKYPAGYLYDDVDPALGCPGALIKYPIYEDKNHVYKQHNVVQADKERDRFAFQFNGKSGIFIIDKNNGDKGIMLGDSKIKIWFTRNESMTYQGEGIRTTITAFYIQDENGLIYKFSKHELTKVLKTNYADGSLTGTQVQPEFGSNNVYHEGSFDNTGIANPYTINSWFLEEIEDALTHRKVTFTYTIHSINAHAGTSFAYYEEKNYSMISYATSITETPQIATITYPDGHLVTFNYGNLRADLDGDKVLAAVDITYQSRSIARYQLTTSYFIMNRYGVPVSEYQKKAARLCLMSVKKIGVDLKAEDAPYYFDYNTGSNNPDDIVPPPFFYLKDVWGYYNGDYSKDFEYGSIAPTIPVNELSNSQIRGLCFLRNGANAIALNPKPGYAANGLLKKIIYPTGGTLSYNYAQNTAVLPGQSTNTNVGGVHVSQTSVTDGGYSNDCTNPIITNYTYTDVTNTQSSLWGVEEPLNRMVSVSHYEPEYKRYHWGLRHGCFPLGCCKYKYQYPGILSRQAAVSLTSKQKTMETISDILDVVGAISQIMDIVTIVGGATGAGAIIALAIDIILDIANIVITCFSDMSKDYYSTAYYNYDLNASNPLPSEFKRVEVSESSGQNGKTVTEFTNPEDYAIWSATNPAFSAKQRFAYWAYGLPKKTTVYDAAGNPVKQTENLYDYMFAKNDFVGHPGTGNDGYASCKCLPTKTYSQRNTDWEDPAKYNAPNTPYVTQSNGDLKADKYLAYSGRVELKTSYERVFKATNPSQFLETVTEYTYNNYTNYSIREIKTTESNGSLKRKIINYSDQYSDPVTLDLLSQNNIIATPVETITYENNAITDETVTEYSITANGDIKPYRTLKRNFSAPFTGWQIYAGPGAPSNPADLKETQKLTYNAAGKIIGMKDDGDRMVTNIYDYNDKFVIASAINADAVLDKCAYSSFETQNLGGWVLNGAASYITTNAVTGNNSFSLSGSNNFTATLNAAKAYKISFWSTTAGIAITNATLVKSAPAINGFTYYEYNIAQGTSGVTVSGTGTIDELRLYPATARMRTVTYDPLIGKTSECDENNRISYYEYDANGRLRFIKDDNRHIVKMYEYNLATPKAGGPCVTTYYNKAITERFRRMNCPAGYIGGVTTYSIAANTYSSTISQAIADLQAQYELDQLGQADANTNGTCYLIYYNAVKVDTFWKQGCPVGYKGTYILYTVPANKYASIISQADADAKALADSKANGQAYANKPGNASCVIDYDPDWIGTGETQCETVNGYSTGNMLYRVKDQNPNSSTYNQMQWTNGGSNPSCGASQLININYTNTENCTAYIILRNKSTNQQYTFYMGPTIYTPTTIGQVPPAVYEVTITHQPYSPFHTIWFSNNSGGYYGQYGGFHLNTISISNQLNPMIKIEY